MTDVEADSEHCFLLGQARLGPLRERIRGLADRETNRLEKPYRLSMSVGGAFMDARSPCSLETLLERADAAMYE